MLGSPNMKKYTTSETVSSRSGLGIKEQKEEEFQCLEALARDSVSTTSEKPDIYIYFSYDYSRYIDSTLKIKLTLLYFGWFPMIKMNSLLHREIMKVFVFKTSFLSIHYQVKCLLGTASIMEKKKGSLDFQDLIFQLRGHKWESELRGWVK